MNKFILYILPVFFLMCSGAADSNDDGENNTVIDPFVQNRLLKATINLGNALEAPNEGDWGITLKDSYFASIKEAGFTAVRIPIRWSAHTINTAPYTIDPFFMARVNWAVDQAENNGLAAMINIHHYEEIFVNPAQEKKKFLAIWRQIAEKFVDKPASVFFEVLNEPHDQLTAELWNSYLAEAIDTIRTIDSTHTIVIGTAEWGGITAMNKLIIPADEKNVIFTFHYYNPFQFTHQGAEWVDGSDGWLGTQWTGSLTEKSNVFNEFSTIKSWAQSRNVPVFLGEFGSYSKADINSRIHWTDFVARTAEADSFSWAYWEFASGFGIYDPNTDLWREPLLKALIP